MSFKLDGRLQVDTQWVASLTLSELRLMNNAAVPWLILVPRKPQCEELTDLDEAEQQQLLQEINTTHTLLGCFKPHKINTGALGNIVRQLHIHVVARFQDDPAWPGPVWGQLPPKAYEDAVLEQRLTLLREQLAATQK